VRACVGVQLALPSLAAEGIAYDTSKDRLVVGSTTSGAIRGVPGTLSSFVQLTAAETFVYFSGGGAVPILSTKGMRGDTSNDCWLWIAVNSNPIGNDCLHAIIIILLYYIILL
jgi:hypothetical protein